MHGGLKSIFSLFLFMVFFFFFSSRFFSDVLVVFSLKGLEIESLRLDFHVVAT